jgi:flagellar basal-body rod protein FlgB
MLFDTITQGLTAGTHYLGLRHRVLANNLANADTPGYKAMDISFNEQLRHFMSKKAPGSESASLSPPILFLEMDSTSAELRKDLNTVNIDQELIKLSQNTILHNSYLQLLRSKFQILKSAISGNV